MLYMASHVTNLATKYEDPTPISSWFISHNVSIGYHWECVRVPCACAELRDRWVGGQKQLHFWNPRPWFAYSLCTVGVSAIKVIKVICENNSRPCVKRHMSVCACAKSRNLLKVPVNVLLKSFCTLTRNRGLRIERRCLYLHLKCINNRFCERAVQMLMTMAVNATICSSAEVQYGKSTSTKTTAIRRFRATLTDRVISRMRTN